MNEHCFCRMAKLQKDHTTSLRVSCSNTVSTGYLYSTQLGLITVLGFAMGCCHNNSIVFIFTGPQYKVPQYSHRKARKVLMITDRTGSNTDIPYLEIINAFWSQISVAPDMNSESKSIHKHMLSIYKCSVHTTYIYMHTHIYVYIVCTHTHIYILHIFIYNCILHILLHCISYIYNSHIHTYICLLCTHGYIASS